MQTTFRDAVTVVHGMGFGALLLLTFSGAVAGLYALAFSKTAWAPSLREHRLFGGYFALMALLAWAAVFAGAYIVYPWYRAHPPAGLADLSGYPQRLLMSDPTTTGWHDIGMEWKEHIAWFAPMSLTAVAYVMWRYSACLRSHIGLRNAVIGLVALGFFSTAVAGFFGAMLNKYAPVRGGETLVILRSPGHE
jgi:hypothetical protein